MSVLSDGAIRRALTSGRLVVAPIEPSQIQPASVDVRLGDDFLVYRTGGAIDPLDPPEMERVSVPEGYPFILTPGEFVLGTTLEEVGIPVDMVARVEGKSSLGRLGLMIHATAGFIDPGWAPAQITLELSNCAKRSIKLWPGMRIGQLSFEWLDAPCERPYGHPELGSRYQGQRGVTASRGAQHADTRVRIGSPGDYEAGEGDAA